MRDNRKPPHPDPQPSAMSPADAPPTLQLARRRWLQHLPYLSLALFLAAIAALVWLTRQYDDEAQRATLISDVLWMEQNLRFNLDRNENHLQEIGPELLAAPTLSAQSEARLASLLTPERGLARILWLSPQGEVLGAMPPLAPARATHDASADGAAVPVDESSLRLARAIGRPV
ncbi:MAG: PAS domain-containing sensor histidine kinase, partial [Thauera sp.]|nr:PAS domain-containing sensor histidine kinase [Thauera sp.]